MAVLDESGKAKFGVQPAFAAARSGLDRTSNPDHRGALVGVAERMPEPLPEDPLPLVGLLAPPERSVRSRRVILAGVAIATLAAGGGIAYTVLKPPPPTPASTVQQYFDDLARDDTTAALALVDGSDQVDGGGASTLLLSSRALASAVSRPSDVHVESTTTALELGSSASTYSVQVSYKVGGTSVSTDVGVLSAPAGGKSAYLLESPFINLQIGDPDGRQVTVNGIALNLDDTSMFDAFPGAYTVTAQASALLAGDSETARLASDPSTGATQATVDFPAPELAQGAQDAVQAQVNRQIDACAQSGDPEPSGCPFDIYSAFIFGDVSAVQWSISAYPTVTVTAETSPFADDQVEFDDSEDDGVAHYVATYTDFNGATQTASGDIPFGVSGTASAVGSTITISFD